MDIFERNHVDLTVATKRDVVGYHYHPTRCWKLVLGVLKNTFFHKYAFQLNTNASNIIFMIGTSSFRFNDKETYSKIRDCAESYDSICMVKKLRLSNVPYNLYLLCKYNALFRKYSIPIIERLFHLRGMLQVRHFLLFFETQKLNQYKVGIVYNDLDQFDNAFVQYLKSINVTTVTCQHGMFSAPRVEGGLGFSGIELQNSIADIFLAWNQMTYDEAVLSGMESSKIRILGIPKCIGIESGIKQETKNAFGVILNFAEFNDYNIQLLQAANYVADKNSMKYYIKFHPSLDLSVYDDYLDERYSIKLPIETSVAEYSSMVDFSILSHSTVYVELLFLRSKVYLLHVDNLCKFTHFPEYDFSSKEELDELMHKDYDVDKMFNYYCFTDNPKHEYMRFFKEIKK